MRLKSTFEGALESEVRDLVKFATRELEMEDVAVWVKNCHTGSYRGTAYPRIPSISHFKTAKGMRYLITIGLDPEAQYPVSNLIVRRGWSKVEEEERDLILQSGRETKTTAAGLLVVEGLISEPYGGKRSPFITCSDWREALVMVAAHEGRHVRQFRYNKPRSEVDAEKFAERTLKFYRNRNQNQSPEGGEESVKWDAEQERE